MRADLASAFDEPTQRRLEDAVAQARRLLGRAEDPDAEPAQLDDLIRSLVERLGEDEEVAAQTAHEAQLARLRERLEHRVQALDRVRAAVLRLREITSPSAMLTRAPQELCEGSDLDRAVISVIVDGVMTAEAAYFRDDADGAGTTLEALRASPVRLGHPLIETEFLRRRRATVVTGVQVHPRVHRGMATIMGWDSFVAAPVAVRSRVIAVIHADRDPAEPLELLQRDVLWEFAAGLAQAYESASLRRTLRHEHDQMSPFLERFQARSAQLTDAAIELGPGDGPPPLSLDPVEPSLRGDRRPDVTALDGILTRRELEVLALLSDGLGNRAVADELVVSNGTVKFHVNNILRKLRVANRAEAVSRYLSLQGLRAPGT